MELGSVLAQPSDTTSISMGGNPPIDLSSVKSILIVKLDGIGDFILLTPFLRGLRYSAPQARIDLLVRPEIFPVAELCPYVNRVLAVALENNTCHITGFHEAATADFLRDLANHDFEIAIVPRWDYDYFTATSIAKACGALHVIGFSAPALVRNMPAYDHLFTLRVERPFPAHEVEHNLALLHFLGGELKGSETEVWIDKEDQERAAKLFSNLPGAGPIVAVCPGASQARRTLPARRWISILNRVKEAQPAIRFLVLGASAEEELSRVLCAGLKDCYSLCGKITLRQTAALINLSSAVITMDSAPAHIAAACQIPSIIFSCHPSNGDPLDNHSPERFRPWTSAPCLVLQPQEALWPCKDRCRGTAPHCITNIFEDNAVNGIVAILKGEVKTNQTDLDRLSGSTLSYSCANRIPKENNSEPPVVSPSRTYCIGNLTIEVPLDNPLEAHQQNYPLHDRFLPFLAEQCSGNEWIIDVGANAGDTVAALIQRTSGSVLSVEGHPDYFYLLEKNVQSMPPNIRNRIRIKHVLIGTGTHVGELQRNSGTTTLKPSQVALNVPRSIDSLITESQLTPESVFLLKTDTDGFDADALLSASNLLKQASPLIFFENEFSTDKQLAAYNELYSMLIQAGYSHFWIFDNFGNLLLENIQPAYLGTLNDYLDAQNRGRSARTIYYYDILACKPDKIGHVCEAIIRYRSFIRGIN